MLIFKKFFLKIAGETLSILRYILYFKNNIKNTVTKVWQNFDYKNPTQVEYCPGK